MKIVILVSELQSHYGGVNGPWAGLKDIPDLDAEI